MIRTIVALAVLAATPAMANECLTVEAELDRLACYDRASGRTPKQEADTSTPVALKWNVRHETSAMTDKTNVYMHVDSDETIDCGWNRGEKIRVVARCHDNTTSLFFQTGCHMASSEYNSYGHIQYRLDDAPAKTMRATSSTNNRALGLWSGGQAIPAIKELLGKDRMTVRMTPYGENPFTASFDISGMGDAIESLRNSCSW